MYIYKSTIANTVDVIYITKINYTSTNISTMLTRTIDVLYLFNISTIYIFHMGPIQIIPGISKKKRRPWLVWRHPPPGGTKKRRWALGMTFLVIPLYTTDMNHEYIPSGKLT